MSGWRNVLSVSALLVMAGPQATRAQTWGEPSLPPADSVRSALPVIVTRANLLRLPTREALEQVAAAARTEPRESSRIAAARAAAGRTLQSAWTALQRVQSRPALVPALAAGLALAGLLCTLLYVRKVSKRRKAAAAEAALPAPSAARKAPDPRLWAARMLAVDGLDVFDIARQTGLPRDVTRLIVRGARRNVPGPASAAGPGLAGGPRRAGRSGGATYWFTES